MPQEEVKIKLGVDGSQVSTGLASLTGVFNKFSSNVTRSLGNLLKVNLASMFGGDIIQIWDKGTQKLSNFIFKVDELTRVGQALERTRQFWRNLRKEIEGEDVARTQGAKDAADDAVGTRLKLAEIDALRTGKSRLDQLKAEQKIYEERLELARGVWGIELSAKETLDLALKLERNKTEQQQIQTAELERQKQMQAAVLAAGKRGMAELRANLATAQGGLAGGVRGLSDVSLGQVEAAVGLQEVPGLRFSRKQIADIQRAQLLLRQSQQARVDGNDLLADRLSRERLDLLKRNPFLAESDRNPLKVAEEQLKIARETLDLALNNGLAVQVKVVKK